jgi:hypothetical protein
MLGVSSLSIGEYEFGKRLKRNDKVVLETTGNISVLVRLLMPFVRPRVVACLLQCDRSCRLS